jgi:hypothetical protein
MIRHAYWSVGTGAEADALAETVRSARAAGVFHPFHLLTDRVIADAECYEAFECDRAHGLHQLHYLKAGMARLPHEWFVWLAPGTRFRRRPVDVLAPLAGAPLHVPLVLDLDAAAPETPCRGVPAGRLRELLRAEGLPGPAWLGDDAFWIIHREAIGEVYDLALGFWHRAKAAGVEVHVSAALSHAAQVLVADVAAHRADRHAALWSPDPADATAALTGPGG